jgi:hypothetical protein
MAMFYDPPGSTNCINLIEEDEAGLLGPRHLKQLSHHPRPLTHVPDPIPILQDTLKPITHIKRHTVSIIIEYIIDFI